jgi:ketosteroid isomerase-like protein
MPALQTEVVGNLIDRFIEALNSRDLESFRELLAEDVEFRMPQGKTLRGADEAQAIITAAEKIDLRLSATGEPEVEGGTVRVPVRELTHGRDAVEGTAEFELRDGRVAAFHVATEV